MARAEGGGRSASPAAFAMALLLAAAGGLSVASAWERLAYDEYCTLAAGAVCMLAGAVAATPWRAYLAGLVFTLAWGWAELRLTPGMTAGDLAAVVLVCGLLALGPVAVLGALLCRARCSPAANGSPTAAAK